MRCVTVGTDGADRQPLGGKAQSMNAGRVVGKGIGFMQPFHLGGFPILPVTFPAELWYVCPVDRGSIVVFGLGGMGAMAIGTIGSILYFFIVRLAMTAGKIIIKYFWTST